MYYEAIICPRCSSVSIVKNGKTAQRKQRYLCKDCRRQFIRDYTNLGCVGAVRDLVVPLTINGAGIRDIERVLFLSPNTILKTLRESATRLDEPACPQCWSSSLLIHDPPHLEIEKKEEGAPRTAPRTAEQPATIDSSRKEQLSFAPLSRIKQEGS
jgi:transposase-like protein